MLLLLVLQLSPKHVHVGSGGASWSDAGVSAEAASQRMTLLLAMGLCKSAHSMNGKLAKLLRSVAHSMRRNADLYLVSVVGEAHIREQCRQRGNSQRWPDFGPAYLLLGLIFGRPHFL